MNNGETDILKVINPDLDLDDLHLQVPKETGEEEDGGYYPMLVIAQ